MTEEEHVLSMQYSHALDGKRKILEFGEMLTIDDKLDIINYLITFENSHIVANRFKDDQVAYTLLQELKQYFKRMDNGV